MLTAPTPPTEKQAQTWRARRRSRRSYRVAGEVSPVAPVDRSVRIPGRDIAACRTVALGSPRGHGLDRLAEGPDVG